ncbi:MAG: hypothetical protein N3F04_01070 [Candidatus Nezhaarchaeota archaeon]|nr:hypothetical protein [Candidatus Nezhaarchaeota archaeon]MCX8141368.1 hypothetical protein [Candidatus Nezhaarchaeota archaeon]MDW8049634.1 S16 family serine protease [Nitrososphaerota archaeon]
MAIPKVLKSKSGSAKIYVLLCLLIISLAFNGILSYILLYEDQRHIEGTPTDAGDRHGPMYLHGVASIYIVGVVGGEEYRGLAMKLEGALIEGGGRVYISTTPKIGIELQEAAEVAFKAAQKFTNIDASDLDLMLTIIGNESVYVVDGPSAGAAVAVLVSSLLLNMPIRSDVVITGTISENGVIGKVGGILYKAEAAARAGAKIFLVPLGQSVDTIYVISERRVGPFTFRYYRPQVVSVEDYLSSMGYNIDIIEVSTLKEAFRYFTSS